MVKVQYTRDNGYPAESITLLLTLVRKAKSVCVWTGDCFYEHVEVSKTEAVRLIRHQEARKHLKNICGELDAPGGILFLTAGKQG